MQSKKLLSYWNAHKQLFYDAVKGAKALPFYPLTVRSYEIFVCIDEEFAPSAGYEVAFKRDRLYFAPQSDSAILASFDALQYRFDELKSDELELGYECQSGAAGKMRKFNSMLKLGLQSGTYELCALGLKNSSQHFEKYGYAFIFKRNASAENQNFDRLDNDKFSFDICEGD
ncbi:hypothetical protein [uncultured Campylobacter sp.]|uniref:hypothetical protein n=1 Tax=uncultured Campylobacter sp. TaxID=218934 RepID=UPI002631C7A8|nr:hypothetical protein [uncultured Campylobacter sp.]